MAARRATVVAHSRQSGGSRAQNVYHPAAADHRPLLLLVVIELFLRTIQDYVAPARHKQWFGMDAPDIRHILSWFRGEGKRMATTSQDIGRYLEQQLRAKGRNAVMTYGELLEVFNDLPEFTQSWASHPLCKMFGDLDI